MKLSLISVANRLYLVSTFIFLCFSSTYAQDLDDSLESQIEEINSVPTSPFSSYFTPLSSVEAQNNYDNIQTNGKIEDISLVPNNRPINDSRVADPHQMLTQSAIDTINQIIRMVETETGYQMAVVCLNSIGSNNPNAFGTDLFNEWGIGEAGKDNGFLMLVVNDVHRVEFINGRGTEIILTDLEGENIRQGEMIPYFKQNDYVTGVIRGLQAVTDVFYGVTKEEVNYSSGNSGTTEYYDYGDVNYDYNYASVSMLDRPIIGLYLKICAVLFGIYLLILAISFFVKDLHRRYHLLKFFVLLIFPILFPLPFLILFFINKAFMNRWRNTERFSETTGTYMMKLDETSDDEYLKAGQVTEEKIKSIDYDVWITPDKSETLVLAYKRWFNKHRSCPSCKFKTYYKEYDRVISAATYSSSGTGERRYSCKNCSHSKTTRYTIPMKTKSESSSGGSYSSGSSGGSYSSGGGSSYGGGSSGGGGGGSSW